MLGWLALSWNNTRRPHNSDTVEEWSGLVGLALAWRWLGVGVGWALVSVCVFCALGVEEVWREVEDDVQHPGLRRQRCEGAGKSNRHQRDDMTL